jgi:hypothetical protein
MGRRRMATLRKKSCTRKKRYSSKAEAEEQRMRYHGKEIHPLLPDMTVYGVYECQFCGGWHVGHRRKFKRRLRRLMADHFDALQNGSTTEAK